MDIQSHTDYDHELPSTPLLNITPGQNNRQGSRQPVTSYFDSPPIIRPPTAAMQRNDRDMPRAPITNQRRIALLWSYAPDWALTITIVTLFFLLDKVSGFKREFSLQDETIQHTFATQERIPNWALGVIAFVAPMVLMPVVNVLTIKSWWDWHNASLGVILSLGLAGSLTQVVKVTVGRPRPDLIDRCRPIEGSQNHAVFGLVTHAICTQTDEAILKDGFRSFFSGHSSLSFAGLGFLSWYLAGKLHLFDKQGHTGKAWIAFAPLTGAVLVAISRTMDNRHHWQDVTVGGIVGIVLSYFAYRQYYPSLESPYSHRPYSPRVKNHDRLRKQSSRPASSVVAAVNPERDPYRDAEEGGVAGDSHVHDHDELLEMDGTVGRGGVPLEEVWHEGEDDEDGRDLGDHPRK